MSPSAPENEDRMQALVASYPEIIADDDGELLLVRREQAVSDSAAGSGRWSLDHLFVTRDAVPVLVELKRAVDTRLRREVVGQLLDYAANATAFWQGGRIAASFAATAAGKGANADDVLSAFIGDRDPADFWAQVDANFIAGRIKLVFVADEIPRELARIVEFLNDQMRADVRAVELQWFVGEGDVVTLNPRVIGQTERAAATKAASARLAPIAWEEWMRKNLAPSGDVALSGRRAFVDMVYKLGGQPSIAARQGSIGASFEGRDGRSFSPLHLWADGTVSLSLSWLHSRPGLKDEAVRRDLLVGMTEIVGPTNTRNLTGFPAFRVERLADPTTSARLEAWLAAALPRMRE
jgi:hypothetical protein